MRTVTLALCTLALCTLSGCTVMSTPIVRDVRTASDGRVVAERCDLHVVVVGVFSNGHVSDCRDVDVAAPASAPTTTATR